MRKINNWTDYNKLVKEETYNVAKIEDTYIYQLESENQQLKEAAKTISRANGVTYGLDTGKDHCKIQKTIYQDAFKFFNVTAEDMGFYNFAKEIVGEPDFNYIPPERLKEEKEKFDLYIKGLWERQEGDK